MNIFSNAYFKKMFLTQSELKAITIFGIWRNLWNKRHYVMYATVVYMHSISDHFTARGNRNTFRQSMKILQISSVFVTAAP